MYPFFLNTFPILFLQKFPRQYNSGVPKKACSQPGRLHRGRASTESEEFRVCKANHFLEAEMKKEERQYLDALRRGNVLCEVKNLQERAYNLEKIIAKQSQRITDLESDNRKSIPSNFEEVKTSIIEDIAEVLMWRTVVTSKEHYVACLERTRDKLLGVK